MLTLDQQPLTVKEFETGPLTALERAVLDMIPETSTEITVGDRLITNDAMEEVAKAAGQMVEEAKQEAARGGPTPTIFVLLQDTVRAWKANAISATQAANTLIEVREALLARSRAVNAVRFN